MDFGWKQIWKLYGWKKLFSWNNRLFYFTVIVTLLLFCSILILNEKNLAYTLVKKILDVDISILPTLLGFNLGAYALIIGFLSNKNLLEALTDKHGTNSATSIEEISGVFAINIITQAFTLLLAFLSQTILVFIENINLSEKWLDILYSDMYTNSVNDIYFLLITFFTLYSIALVIQNAINIFDFNQLFTYFSFKKQEDE
ncbi:MULTISPECIES: hypothetical protein [unclassified Mucilaginibacter]|uniref:hypothetical protein n=1 Tax=unclassified Mucilaginibacter TaxID=2617802 RepID=UPI002AC8BE9D|nr:MULTISPECIES: hypothetical protein [unclassified Mucilaginibacter]MEB0263392.1 hypothetical protein [Mucilaginibacter sp. 10I4]MEB0278579.1 hypothetical protein [Mucilaginibacter sp. 10B2]MEB0299289.1 hypothetical protein [Mucilaginibacter sp. 5C4]WPX23466.1 hypothetical protein RHM67_19510 [Mucilaginibacter sp. 5C4]